MHSYAQGARLLQLCVYAILFVVLLVWILSYPVNLREWRFYGTVTTLAALLILNIVWSDTSTAAPARLQVLHDWLFLTLSTALTLAAVWMSGLSDLAPLLAIVCAQAGFKRGVWPVGVGFAAASLAAWLLLSALMGFPLQARTQVASSLAVGSIFVLMVITLLRRYTQQTLRAEALLKELQAANLELEEAHQKEKALAVAEERMRLAHDIHDGLGHHLIVLIVQLQAARKLVERDAQAAAQAVEVCQTEAQQALEEVRASVSAMRQPAAESRPLPEALAHLAKRFGQHTGLQIRFEASGEPRELAPFAQETLFRAAQEGLTNAQKHAVALHSVAIRLAYTERAVCLSVEDDGRGAASAAKPGGFGLAGLRERAAQLGGSFRCGPGAAGGFIIEIELPFEGH